MSTDHKKPGPGPGKRPAAKAVGAKPVGAKPVGVKPAGAKPMGAKPVSVKPAYGKPAASKPMGARPVGERSMGARPVDARPVGAKPVGAKPVGARTSGTKPVGQRPVGAKPMGARPVGERSMGARPVDARPAGAKPVGTKYVGAKPVGAKPISVKPAYGKPAAPRPVGAKPASSRPASSRPAASRPASDKPAFSRPASSRPVSDKPAYSKPAASRPGQVRPRPAPRSPARSMVGPVETTGLSTPARRQALTVLRDVHQNGAFAALALNEHLSKSALKPADRRLVTSIVYGTLENQIKIDFALDRLMDHPTHEPVQRDILRLSACQILFHDRVPDSAAVNEGVNLAKVMGMESAVGFLNAVLRNLVRGKEEIPWPRKEDGLREYLHIMGSMPLWIVDRLLEAYGPEEAEKIVMHRAEQHPLAVRPNMLRLTDAQFESLLQKKAWQCRRALAPHAYFVTGAAEMTLDNDYQRGLFSIQGQSSLLAAEAVQAKPGMKILDACAAPGGKSAYLCESMQGTGRVYAWELHEKRAMLLESTKRRLGLENLRISVRDAAEPKPDMDGTLDAVLLDAPCSGLGVMVEKPDLKYRVQPEDIGPIVESQQRLLSALCRYVKPGGLLVYSTCSILPEENADQTQAFLAAHPEFTVEMLPTSFPESLRNQQTRLGLQLLGYRDQVEGFYIVRLRKARA